MHISWHCLHLQLGSLTTGLVGGYALKTILKFVPVTISKRISKNWFAWCSNGFDWFCPECNEHVQIISCEKYLLPKEVCKEVNSTFSLIFVICAFHYLKSISVLMLLRLICTSLCSKPFFFHDFSGQMRQECQG